MYFNWVEYLLLAKEMASPSLGLSISHYRANPESKERSAISRAYYAAFIMMRNYLSTSDENFLRSLNSNGRRISHEQVICYLEKSSDRKLKSLGEDLRTLRNKRNQADYDNVFGDKKIISTLP
jgi:hypothetical protein